MHFIKVDKNLIRVISLFIKSSYFMHQLLIYMPHWEFLKFESFYVISFDEKLIKYII